jgi:hypothetical protein
MEVLRTHGLLHGLHAAFSEERWNVTNYLRTIFGYDTRSLSCTYAGELWNRTLLKISSNFHMKVTEAQGCQLLLSSWICV